ncbi:hypothetical protein U1Q18_033781 [Sarracenia purpurea var. burkii]
MDSSETRVRRPPCACLLHRPNHHHHHHHFSLCHHRLSHHHHHHHHHLHFSLHCPLHSHLLQPKNHRYTCPNSLLLPNRSNFPVFGETYPSDPLLMQEANKGAEEKEDEEEPVFVLTDEWKEFFAESEAKRRLAKKQAIKKGKT